MTVAELVALLTQKCEPGHEVQVEGLDGSEFEVKIRKSQGRPVALLSVAK